MQCPRCHQADSTGQKFCGECGAPLNSPLAAERPYADLQTENEGLRRSLGKALDQQTATSEILRAMSGSLTDVQPVFDTIVRSGLRLLGGYSATMMLLRDGDGLDLVAYTSTSTEADASLVEAFPMPLRNLPPGERAVHDRRPHAVEDVESAPDVTNVMRETGRARGWHSNLFIPMIREDVALGLISITRRDPGPFSADQIALVQTFADQAVIAIENVRLFKELEVRNRALSEGLDRQTATADVLRIIAQSPTELQPVLDVIATSALRLCAASDVVIERLEGDRFYNAAHAGTQMKGLVGLPLPLTRRFPGGRAILDRKRIIIDDMQQVAESEYPDTLELLKLNTVHSCAEIPLLSEGKPLGNLAVLRAEVRPFTDAEITLLETFADQAVIAIENVRLFKELEARNRDLTATGEQIAPGDLRARQLMCSRCSTRSRRAPRDSARPSMRWSFASMGSSCTWSRTTMSPLKGSMRSGECTRAARTGEA